MTNNYDFALKYGAGVNLYSDHITTERLIDGALTGENGLCRVSSCSQVPTHKTFYDGQIGGMSGMFAYCLKCAQDRREIFPKQFTPPVPLEDNGEEEWA